MSIQGSLFFRHRSCIPSGGRNHALIKFLPDLFNRSVKREQTNLDRVAIRCEVERFSFFPADEDSGRKNSIMSATITIPLLKAFDLI
jgi:hypothetical protein